MKNLMKNKHKIISVIMAVLAALDIVSLVLVFVCPFKFDFDSMIIDFVPLKGWWFTSCMVRISLGLMILMIPFAILAIAIPVTALIEAFRMWKNKKDAVIVFIIMLFYDIGLEIFLLIINDIEVLPISTISLYISIAFDTAMIFMLDRCLPDNHSQLKSNAIHERQ